MFRLGQLLPMLVIMAPLGAGPTVAAPTEAAKAGLAGARIAQSGAAPDVAAPAAGALPSGGLPPAGAAAAATPGPAPVPSSATDPAARVEACLADRQIADHRACVGLAAEGCLDAAGGIADPATLAECHAAEGAVWQARLDAALGRLAASEAASDAAEAAGPGTGRRAALEVAQAAWMGWAAAECGWMRRQAQGGGGEAPAEAACRTRLTAERALFLGRAAAAQAGP